MAFTCAPGLRAPPGNSGADALVLHTGSPYVHMPHGCSEAGRSQADTACVVRERRGCAAARHDSAHTATPYGPRADNVSCGQSSGHCRRVFQRHHIARQPRVRVVHCLGQRCRATHVPVYDCYPRKTGADKEHGCASERFKRGVGTIAMSGVHNGVPSGQCVWWLPQ